MEDISFLDELEDIKELVDRGWINNAKLDTSVLELMRQMRSTAENIYYYALIGFALCGERNKIDNILDAYYAGIDELNNYSLGLIQQNRKKCQKERKVVGVLIHLYTISPFFYCTNWGEVKNVISVFQRGKVVSDAAKALVPRIFSNEAAVFEGVFNNNEMLRFINDQAATFVQLYRPLDYDDAQDIFIKNAKVQYYRKIKQ